MKNENEHVDCSLCLRKTNHVVLLDETRTEQCTTLDTGNGWINSCYGYRYTVYECLGCNNIVMRKALVSDDIHPDEYSPSYVSWLPAIITRQIPDWYRQLPEKQMNLLVQVYQALHAESYALVLMGLRAILDMYIVEMIGDEGTFKEKLEKLVTEGFLSSKQKESLETALDAGSAAAHRGYEGDIKTCNFVISVIELLLHQTVLANMQQQVKSKIPARKKST